MVRKWLTMKQCFKNKGKRCYSKLNEMKKDNQSLEKEKIRSFLKLQLGNKPISISLQSIVK